EMNRRPQTRESRLCEGISRSEEGLLCLQHVQEIGDALAILELRDLKCLPGSIHFPTKVLHLQCVIADLTERTLDVAVGIEYRALVARDELFLCGVGKILLPDQLAAVEYRLHELRPGFPEKARPVKQRIGRSAAEAGTATQGELRQEGRAGRLQVGMCGREIRLRLGHIGPA